MSAAQLPGVDSKAAPIKPALPSLKVEAKDAKKSVSIAPGTADNEKPKAPIGAVGAATAPLNTEDFNFFNRNFHTEDDEFVTSNCRMYESKYPDAGDLVIVQVKNVTEVYL